MPPLQSVLSLLARLLTRYGNMMLEFTGASQSSEERRAIDIPLESRPGPWERP